MWSIFLNIDLSNEAEIYRDINTDKPNIHERICTLGY